jgi:hypothetical protein
VTDSHPDGWPRHPVDTWQHALVCMSAGVPVPPESAAALAVHDRGARERPEDVRSRDARRNREVMTAAKAVVKSAGGVLDIDTAARRMDRAGWDGEEFTRVVLGRFPVSLAYDEDGKPVDSVNGAGWYDHHGRVIVVTGTTALRKWLARHPVPEPVPGRTLHERNGVRRGNVPHGPSGAPTAHETAPAPVLDIITAATADDDTREEVTRRALDMLDDGATITRAARACGVSRHTLARWVEEDAAA